MFNREELNGSDPDRNALSGLRIVCIPAGDEADELAGMMIGQLLEHLGCDVRHMPFAPGAALLDEIAKDSPQIAIVSALPPFAVGRARSLGKRLRQRYPELKTILGLWNFDGDAAKAQERLRPGDTDMIATSLHQTILLLSETNQSTGSGDHTQAPTTLHKDVIATRL